MIAHAGGRTRRFVACAATGTMLAPRTMSAYMVRSYTPNEYRRIHLNTIQSVIQYFYVQ